MTQLIRTVGADADDVDCNGGTFNDGGPFGLVGVGYYYGVKDGGFRFTNVTVPKGSTIDSAYFKPYADNDYPGAGTLHAKLYGHDADSSAQWSSGGNRPDTCDVTSAYIDFDSATHGTWSAGTQYTSGDIKAIIQEIIDRENWQSGNALSIVWRDDGSSADENYRSAEDINDVPANAAQLEINYTAGTTAPTIVATLSGSNIEVSWT